MKLEDRLRATTRVLDDVENERARQIVVEGFSPASDDRHDPGLLARAAACYARFAGLVLSRDAIAGGPDVDRGVPRDWPWSRQWWKPRTPRRDLIRALALLVAEVERIDRAADSELRDARLAPIAAKLGLTDLVAEADRLLELSTTSPAAEEAVRGVIKRNPQAFRDLVGDRNRQQQSDSGGGLVHAPPADSSPPACDVGSDAGSSDGGSCGGGE